MIAIDVYRTDAIDALERWGGKGILVHPGTDAALALCLTRIAFEVGFADREFLASQCLGAEEFEVHVRHPSSGNDVEEASRITGVPQKRIVELARELQRARSRSSRPASAGRGGATARWDARAVLARRGARLRAPVITRASRTSISPSRASCGATTR